MHEQYTRWQVITTFDIATDVGLSLLPGILVSRLNMPLESKIEVAFAFALRMPLIVLSVLHLYSIKQYLNSKEPQFSITNALLYQQAMLVWSIISATIPHLRSFMKVFSFQMGLTVHDPNTATVNHTGEAIALQTIGGISTLRKSGRRNRRQYDDESVQSFFHPENIDYEATVDSVGSYNAI